MAIIAATSKYVFNPFAGASSGTYVRQWNNRLFGFVYIDSVPAAAQVLVFNPAMSEILGSTISDSGDGHFEVTTIPKRYSTLPLVVTMLPIGISDAVPLIKTGEYPA